MKILRLNSWIVLFFAATCLIITPGTSCGEERDSAHSKYLSLPLVKTEKKGSDQKILNQYGVPFIEGTLPLKSGGSARMDIGCQTKRIFILGMTESPNISCWADPKDYSVRCFIGDEVGRIRLDYVDGSTQVFPLISGESIWWGKSFYRDPGPFPTNSQFRNALASSLCLFPPTPVEDGNYIASITPKKQPGASSVRVNGKYQKIKAEQSGDSW